jgi:pantetheine-phosphate adenylyltransferase
MYKAIYPGSFDPITYGHIDIIERCSKLYDHLIVGVIEKNKKFFLFNSIERKKIIEHSLLHLENVEVKVFNSLLVDFAKNENCNVVIRGLRVLSDFEYEFKMALMNRNLNDNVTTLFMMPHEKYTHVSSSLLKEVSSLGGDINDYAPKLVIEKMNAKNAKNAKK